MPLCNEDLSWMAGFIHCKTKQNTNKQIKPAKGVSSSKAWEVLVPYLKERRQM